MDLLPSLIDKYKEHPAVRALYADQSREALQRCLLKGYSGAQISFLLAGLYHLAPKTQLYIASDKEEAAYFQNNLASIFPNRMVHFLPDSFKNPTFFEQVNKSNILQRSELVNVISISSRHSELIVTYPEALFEKVVAPEHLQGTRIFISVKEKLDINFLIEVLVEYHFKRVDFVYEPGQFSIRGGIIDIFSYGNEWPYRVELFDDEVENIRTFDPSTQLSVQKISKVAIVPNINKSFSSDQKVSLLSILPDDTLIWLKDKDSLIERLQNCFEKARDFAAHLHYLEEPELEEIFKDRAFITPGEIIRDLERFDIYHLKESADTHYTQTINLRAKPQPSFNKNFQLLIADLQQNTEDGLENYIFTENPQQIERFHAIFNDLGADVSFTPVIRAIDAGFIDEDLLTACYTDHQIFNRYHNYKLRKGYSQDQAITIRMLHELRSGDYVTHIDHGIGRYSGLEKITTNGKEQECVRLIYKNNDILYVGINSLHKISRYIGKDGSEPTLNKLGSDAWANLKRKTKSKLKDMAGELIKLYAARKASKGFAFSPDGYLQNELEASFFYEDTPDQLQSVTDVKEDMSKPYPMDRLLCGDVGFGKTEVAVRAAFKAVTDGKQVAILVPTTILALQHYKTFKGRLEDFGVEVMYINRFLNAVQKKEALSKLKEGKIDIIIGTHALLGKEVGFKDLGLLVVDEEQKFGVAAKEKLRQLQVNVDTLTLTATPIPRTLQFSLMAARDLSIIRTPPPNRLPIQTEVRVFNEEVIKEAIYNEIYRGGQVFFLHNRVKSLSEITEMIRKLCPEISIASVHGQLEPKALEQTLVDFMEGKYEVLVCTNIIETGLDIPNANTIIINNAHQFGLSDLHQLRGRVGRSDRKAYCYLFSPPLSTLTSEARKRLRTIEEFSDLGSGFQIAMRDMDIRGAGNLLGGEQSGFISEIGYDTYQKILEEAMQELKETDFKELFKDEIGKKWDYVRDVQIETDIEMMIPDSFVSNIQERLTLYTDLDRINDEEGIRKFQNMLTDRFGDIPRLVYELFEGLRLRWQCKQLGIERVILKSNKLRCYFVQNPQSSYYESPIFKGIMDFIAKQGFKKDWTLKQSGSSLIMIREPVKTLASAKALLEEIAEKVLGVEAE